MHKNNNLKLFKKFKDVTLDDFFKIKKCVLEEPPIVNITNLINSHDLKEKEIYELKLMMDKKYNEFQNLEITDDVGDKLTIEPNMNTYQDCKDANTSCPILITISNTEELVEDSNHNVAISIDNAIKIRDYLDTKIKYLSE